MNNSLKSYKVVGVIGTDDSVTTGPVAQVLSTFNMPLLSFWASNDALSNQRLYPNFWRVLAPDTYLLLALADFLTLHNFNYVSIMFSNTRRSIAMYWTLKKHLSLHGICVSRKLMIDERTNITKVLMEMLEDQLVSRVIVVVGDHMLTNVIMASVTGSSFEGQFLWIGNDFWEAYIHNKKSPIGSLALHYNSAPLPDFQSYLQELDTNNKNPWFLKALNDIDGCQDIPCIKRSIDKTIKNPSKVLALMHDCPFVFAYALDAFLRFKCPGLLGKSVSDCFYANFDSFPRYISLVKFKRNIQVFKFAQKHGFEAFSMIQADFSTSDVPLEISHYSLRRRTTVILNRILTSQLSVSHLKLKPSSYCMTPCTAGEYRYYISRCCWRCIKCQDNQRVGKDFKTCEQCPPLYWPRRHKSKIDICTKISPKHFDLFTLKFSAIITVACAGIISVCLVLNEYLKNKAHQIIKASSLELSIIQLIFILLGYLAVPVIVARPSTLGCIVGALLFTASFNVSYFTMLIKAIRVYRIFSLSKKGAAVAYTSPSFQVSVCAGFFVCEVLRFFLINQFYPIGIGHFQPDSKVNYVEMACKIPKAQLIPFCTVALVLLFLCSVYAFKTQTLPSNFKESRFVSMCVMTTLLIWSVFMPNYFTTQHFQLKIFYILLALLINHSTALTFLFLTRILAMRLSSRRLSYIPPKTFFVMKSSFERTSLGSRRAT